MCGEEGVKVCGEEGLDCAHTTINICTVGLLQILFRGIHEILKWNKCQLSRFNSSTNTEATEVIT